MHHYALQCPFCPIRALVSVLSYYVTLWRTIVRHRAICAILCILYHSLTISALHLTLARQGGVSAYPTPIPYTHACIPLPLYVHTYPPICVPIQPTCVPTYAPLHMVYVPRIPLPYATTTPYHTLTHMANRRSMAPSRADPPLVGPPYPPLC